MQLKDRIFVVSGGASGLGCATVLDLHAHSAYTAILDLNESAGSSLIASLSTPSHARFFKVDVTNTTSIQSAVKGIESWTQETGLQIGGVIAAAGVGNPAKMIDREGRPLPLEGFEFVMNINVKGTVDLVRQLLPVMTKNKPEDRDGDAERGVVVMVSSVAAFDGQPGQVSYAASKGAVASMTLPMARDLAPYGIRVVTIAPGVFASRMTDMMSTKVKRSLEGVMQWPKRMGGADEFAHLVRTVLENKMLNAEVIRLDGGIRMPAMFPKL